MAYSIKLLDSDALLLEYAGLVDCGERAEAITAAARRVSATGADRLLIDFTRAVAVDGDRAERVDFIARAITAWPGSGIRVAFVNGPRSFAWPVEMACDVRNIPIREFDSHAQAMAWLADAREAGSATHLG
jgi:hypothetical protein